MIRKNNNVVLLPAASNKNKPSTIGGREREVMLQLISGIRSLAVAGVSSDMPTWMTSNLFHIAIRFELLLDN